MSIATSISEPTELFDRNRLLVDLDEATDPDSPDAVLVVVGLQVSSETSGEIGTHPGVTQLRERLAAIVGGSGAVYRTRSSEVCAILDGGVHDLADVLRAVREDFLREATQLDVGISTGIVELPREADGAPEALELADRRMTAADSSIR